MFQCAGDLLVPLHYHCTPYLVTITQRLKGNNTLLVNMTLLLEWFSQLKKCWAKLISEEDVMAVQPARINYHQFSKAAVYLCGAGSQADGCQGGQWGGSHSNHHPVKLLLTSLYHCWGKKPRLTTRVPISSQTFASQLQLGFPILCSNFLISPCVSSLYGL